MSTTVIQNKFDGGYCEDPRTLATDQCQECLNFDSLTNPHYLQPYADTVEEFETISSSSYAAGVPQLSEAAITSFSSTPSGPFVAYGYENDGATTVNTKPQFFFKTSYNGNWSASGYQGTRDLVKGSLVIYKDTPYVLENTGGSYYLIRATAMTSLGSVAATNFCRGFVHPEDNVLYMGFDNTISKWDEPTFTSYSSIIPSNLKIISLTNYGTYLAILCSPTSSIGKSVLYLWGRDGTINTLQGVIDVGNDNAKIVENIDDELVVVSTTPNYLSTTRTQKIIVRVYSGGTSRIAKIVAQTALNGTIYSGYKAKSQSRLYFTGDAENCLYVFGRNQDGRWVLTKDRYLNNGTTQNVYPSQQSFSLLGDILYVGFKTDAAVTKFYRTGTTYTSTCVYKTTINPSMPVADRSDLKQLEAVQVAFTGVASGTIAVKYSVDGSTMTSLISQSTSATEDAVSATSETSGTVLLSGKEFTFQIECTGGVSIKELRYRYSKLNNPI